VEDVRCAAGCPTPHYTWITTTRRVRSETCFAVRATKVSVCFETIRPSCVWPLFTWNDTRSRGSYEKMGMRPVDDLPLAAGLVPGLAPRAVVLGVRPRPAGLLVAGVSPAAIRPWVTRLYAEPESSLFVRVQVWPTKKSFLAYLNESQRSNGRRFGYTCEGTCSREERWFVPARKTGRPARKDRCFAEVNLWKGKLGMEVVTHELFHATMAWAWRVKFPFDSLAEKTSKMVDEERITYVHGRLCKQLVAKGLRPGGVYADGAYTAKAK